MLSGYLPAAANSIVINRQSITARKKFFALVACVYVPDEETVHWMK